MPDKKKEWVGGLTTKERVERSSWLERQGERAKKARTSPERFSGAAPTLRPGQVRETSPGKFVFPRTSDIYLPTPAPEPPTSPYRPPPLGPSWAGNTDFLQQLIASILANRGRGMV